MAAGASATLGISCRGGAVALDACDRIAPVPAEIETTRFESRSHAYWSARWEFLALDACRFDGVEKPADAFMAEATARLLAAAAWLDGNDPAVFAELRAVGAFTVVLLGLAATEGNVLHLKLPPEFLRACGRLDLDISIDFSARSEEEMGA